MNGFRKINIFSQLDQAGVDLLKANLKPIRLLKGTTLFREGTSFTHFYVVESGFAKVLKVNGSQVDVLVGITGPQDSIGEFAIFNHMTYPVTAAALTDMTVLALAAPHYLELRRMSPPFAYSTIERLYDRFSQLNQRVANLANGDARTRTLDFFAFLKNHFGIRQPNGQYRIPFILNRFDLASSVNLQKETMIRIMSQLRKENLIITEKDGFLCS